MPISDRPTLASHQMKFRVEYHDTDGQRRVHHANYPVYFERGRVEMLREAGVLYRDLENDGIFLVVTEMHTLFFDAAEFDDELTLTTEVIEIRKVRISHRYLVHRGDTLIAEAESTIACVTHDGRPSRLPERLQQTFRDAGLIP